VVANSGTSLSVYQIRLLHRFTENIVLLYDGDEAGIHAAMRGTDMLLAEGMNIKVLILPDGDDPDSFARKHHAEEFKAYIKEHQTDFIQFKTNLLLKGVTDPVKRSEAIGSIVKSISVITDPIKRDTYLHDCAMRLGANEQTLINTMNNYIRTNKEERRKEREHERNNEQHQVPGSFPAETGHTNTELHALLPVQGSKVERLLAQAIVRHGDEILFDNLETEDGQKVSMTVAQYIDYDLLQDGLQFSDECYRQMLSEAVEHSGEPDFKAESYFMRHPDHRISEVAANLAISRYQLSASMDVPKREGDLVRHVTHLVLDFRMDVVEQQMKLIQQELREAGSDMKRVKELMEQYKKTQELRNTLARQLGNDVIA
jgi:DNA primase